MGNALQLALHLNCTKHEAPIDPPSIYAKLGLCPKHPDIQLRKRGMFGRWVTIKECCPQCHQLPQVSPPSPVPSSPVPSSPVNGPEPPQQNNNTPNRDNQYPLDGFWIVRFENGERDQIFVKQNAFTYGPFRYVLDLSVDRPTFQCPSHDEVQTATEGLNLREHPQGPTVGSQIVWSTSQNERMVWTRMSVGDNPDTVAEQLRHEMTKTAIDWDQVRQLVPKYPDACKKRNNVGQVLLHYACGANAPLDVVQLLVEKWPNSVQERDSNGWLPLHFACILLNPRFNVIEWLLDTWPESLNERVNDGRSVMTLPVDITVANFLLAYQMKQKLAYSTLLR